MAFNINAHVLLSGPKNIKAVTNSIKKQLGTIKATVKLDIPKNLNKDLSGVNKQFTTLNTKIGNLRATTASLNQQMGTLSTHFQQLSSSSTSVSKAQGDIQKNLHKTGKEVNRVGNEIQAFGKDAALAIRRFSAFTVATGVVFGFVRSVQTATKAAINYEREITKIIQVTGASAVQIDGLNKSITQLSTSLGVDANELAELGRIFAQTGQTIGQVQASIRAVARSSLAPTFGEMKNTAEGLIAAMAQFNIAASRQEEVLAGLNAVSKKFAVEAEDLVSVIRRAGGVFSQASGQFRDPVDSLNELVGIFTAVRSTTRESADTISVGLRTIFTRIQRRGTIDFLKQFNIELVNAQGNFIGLFPAFQELARGLDSIIKRGDALTLSAITEELGGVRQVGKLIPAITQFNKALEATKIAGQAAGEGLGKDVALGLQPLGKQFELLQQRFNAFIREISQSQTFQGLAKVALSLGNAFLTVAETLKPLLPLITTFASIKISKGLFDFTSGFIGGLRKGGGAGGAGGALGSAITGGGGGGGGGGGAAADTALAGAIRSLTTSQNRLITASDRLNATISTANRSLGDQGLDLEIAVRQLDTSIDGLGAIINSLPAKLGGLGGFGGFGPRGGKPRKFAKGGPVHGPSHAQGGVPAILEGGEYVIPKGYAAGGIALQAKKGARDSFGAFILKQFGDKNIATTGQSVTGSGFDRLKGKIRSKLMSRKPSKFSKEELSSVNTKDKQFKNFLTQGESGTRKNRLIPLGVLPAEATGAFGKLDSRRQQRWKRAFLTQKQRGRGTSGLKDIKRISLQGPFPAFSIAGKGEMNADLSQEFEAQSRSILSAGIKKLSKSKFIKKLSSDLKPLSVSKNKLFNFDKLYEGAAETVEGFLLEGIIAGLTNAKVTGGGSNFDFEGLATNANTQSRLQALFGNDAGIRKLKRADAKRQLSTATSGEGKLVNKVARVLQASQFNITKYAAAGGSIFAPRGTDTVPAMLTPGEFVVNKQSAKKVGYGTLGRINRMKDGGVVPSNGVQYLAAGTGTASGGGADALGLAFGLESATSAVAAFTVALASFDSANLTPSLISLAMAASQAGIAFKLLAPNLTASIMANKAVTGVMGKFTGQFKTVGQEFGKIKQQFQAGKMAVIPKQLNRVPKGQTVTAGGKVYKGGQFLPRGMGGDPKLLAKANISGIKNVFRDLKSTAPKLLKGVFTGFPGIIASLIAAPLINAIAKPFTEAVFGAMETIEGTDVQGRTDLSESDAGMAGAISGLGGAVASALAVAAPLAMVPFVGPLLAALGGVTAAVVSLRKSFRVGQAQQREFDAINELDKAFKEANKVLGQFDKITVVTERSLSKLNKSIIESSNAFGPAFDAGVQRRTAQSSLFGVQSNPNEALANAQGLQDNSERLRANADWSKSILLFVGDMFAASRQAKLAAKGFEDINKAFDTATKNITPEFVEQIDNAFIKSTESILRQANNLDSGIADGLADIDVGDSFSSANDQAQRLNHSLTVSEQTFGKVDDALDAANGGASRLVEEYNKLASQKLLVNLTKSVKDEAELLNAKGSAELKVAFRNIRDSIDFDKSAEQNYRNLNAEIDNLSGTTAKTRSILRDSIKSEIERQQAIKDTVATNLLAAEAAARAQREFDALAAGLDNFSAQTKQISDQLGAFTQSLKSEFDDIFSGNVTIGSVTTTNPFDNLETATRSQIASGMEQVRSLSGRPDDPAFSGLESLIATSKDIPFALRNALTTITERSVGDTEGITSTEVMNEVLNELRQSGVDTDALPPSVISGINETIREGVNRQDDDVDMQQKLNKLLGEQGDVAKELVETAGKAKSAMSVAFDASVAYRNAILEVARLQQEMVKKEREFRLSMLDKEAKLQDRIANALGDETGSSAQARTRLGARIQRQTAQARSLTTPGLTSGVGGVQDPFSLDQLMSQRRKLQEERDKERKKLGLKEGEVFDPARVDTQDQGAQASAERLGLLNDQLNGNTAALKELSGDVTVLAAIEREIANLQKKAAAAGKSAMSFDEARIAVASGEMTQEDFDKNFGDPLRALQRASEGGTVTANEAIRLRQMQNDPRFAGFFDQAIENETRRRKLDGEDITEAEVRRETDRRFSTQIAGVAAATGVASDLTPMITNQHARRFALEDEARARGDEMAGFGGMQMDADQRLFEFQKEQMKEVFKTAKDGFQIAVDKFQAAVDDFRRLRGRAESPVEAAQRLVDATQNLESLEAQRKVAGTPEEQKRLDRQVMDAKEEVRQAKNDLRNSEQAQKDAKRAAEAEVREVDRRQKEAEQHKEQVGRDTMSIGLTQADVAGGRLGDRRRRQFTDYYTGSMDAQMKDLQSVEAERKIHGVIQASGAQQFVPGSSADIAWQEEAKRIYENMSPESTVQDFFDRLDEAMDKRIKETAEGDLEGTRKQFHRAHAREKELRQDKESADKDLKNLQEKQTKEQEDTKKILDTLTTAATTDNTIFTRDTVGHGLLGNLVAVVKSAFASRFVSEGNSQQHMFQKQDPRPLADGHADSSITTGSDVATTARKEQIKAVEQGAEATKEGAQNIKDVFAIKFDQLLDILRVSGGLSQDILAAILDCCLVGAFKGMRSDFAHLADATKKSASETTIATQDNTEVQARTAAEAAKVAQSTEQTAKATEKTADVDQVSGVSSTALEETPEGRQAISIAERQRKHEEALKLEQAEAEKTTKKFKPENEITKKKKVEAPTIDGASTHRLRSENFSDIRKTLASSPDAHMRQTGKSLDIHGPKPKAKTPQRMTAERIAAREQVIDHGTRQARFMARPAGARDQLMSGSAGVVIPQDTFQQGARKLRAKPQSQRRAIRHSKEDGSVGEVLSTATQSLKTALIESGVETGAQIALGMQNNIEGIGKSIAEEIKSNLAGHAIDINANVGPIQVQITDGGGALKKLGDGMVGVVTGAIRGTLNALFNTDRTPVDPGLSNNSTEDILSRIPTK